MKFFLPFIVIGLLCGCGRKPTGLANPDPSVADAYPQQYPKPQPGEEASKIPDTDLPNKYIARPEPGLQP
jgi:hypothetical protein